MVDAKYELRDDETNEHIVGLHTQEHTHRASRVSTPSPTLHTRFVDAPRMMQSAVRTYVMKICERKTRTKQHTAVTATE